MPARAEPGSLCPAPIRIAWFDSHPYHFRDTDGTITGLDIELLTHVLDKLGCRYVYVEMPLKRLLTEIRHGYADVALGASRAPEREGYARFSVPYRRELMVMFMRAGETDRFKPRSLADIVPAGLTMGVMIGSWYGAEFDHQIKSDPDFRGRVLQASDYEFLYKGLLHGRVDIVINDLFNGADMLRKGGQMEKFAVHPFVINDDITHFMFSRDTVSDDFMSALDQTLTSFEASTEFTAIAQKYVPDAYLPYLPVQKAEKLTPPPKIGSGAATMLGRR